MRFPLLSFLALSILLCAAVPLAHAQIKQAQLDIISGHYTGTDPDNPFDSVTLVNDVVGATAFYQAGYFGQSTVIANVEGGYIWDQHEVFDRSSFGLGPAVTQFVSDPSITGQYDFHATMVGHVLGGAGYVDTGTSSSFSYTGIGMAPFSELWSGAIATSFSSTAIGSFETTTESTLTPYKTFFRGINGQKADVINSSWGGSDPAATTVEARTIDALSRENPTVAFVVAAGNSGTATVSSPGTNYNGITVGSLGGTSFLTPSDYSSRGPADFVIPGATPDQDVILTGVRAAVDIAAPGEQMFLAAYLGPTGSLQSLTDITQNPSPTDQYFVNEDGTSFATPVVSGGIALLKDAAKGSAYALSAPAFDTRVIKSVLMAGARETEGWNNGQVKGSDGIIRTTQSLDYATGAGSLDLVGAATVYLLSDTRDVAGLGGGSISSTGWDYGSVGLGGANDYIFNNPFSGQIELTISLNWFADREIDSATDLGKDISFANLNLQLWLVVNGILTQEVAESSSLYNNSEFLRLVLDGAGTYALRVVFQGMIYDLSSSVSSETYGLAWRTESVPEPATCALLALAASLIFLRSRKLSFLS